MAGERPLVTSGWVRIMDRKTSREREVKSVPSSFTHEELTRRHEIRGSSNRAFGLVAATFFLLLALAPLRKHGNVRGGWLVVSGAFLALAILRPIWLQRLNWLWIRLGILLGKVVTPVVMAALFFLIFTPMAFFIRMLGKDPLHLARSPQARSYWIERVPPGPAPDTMSNQF